MKLTKKQIDVIIENTPPELSGSAERKYIELGACWKRGANWSYQAGYILYKGQPLLIVTVSGLVQANKKGVKKDKLQATRERVRNKFFELGYITLVELDRSDSLKRLLVYAGRENEINAAIDTDSGELVGARFTKCTKALTVSLEDVRGEAFFNLEKSDIKAIFEKFKGG